MQVNFVVDPKNSQKISSWEFRPVLENSGTTPTRQARHHVNYFSLPVSVAFPPKQFTFPDLHTPEDPTEAPFGLGPREIATGALLSISKEVITNVKDRRQNLYFWGWATYRDVFPKTPEHITMFCFALSGIRGELVPNAQQGFLWSLCNRHNCEDDECKGEPYGTPTKIWR
jgi:hypothetical protein